MPYTYTINVGSTATGPWSLADTTANTIDTISGLTPGATYYFQIIPTDTSSKIQGPATVIGPISPNLNPTAPVLSAPTGVTQTQATLNWTAST